MYFLRSKIINYLVINLVKVLTILEQKGVYMMSFHLARPQTLLNLSWPVTPI